MPRTTTERTPARRLADLPEGVVALGVALAGALLGLTATFRGPFFFYVGDGPESFVPLWSHFGRELLAGNWWLMEASGWMGGNYVGEAAYAQWNPILLADYVLVSLFDNLAWAAAVVSIQVLALLALAAYLLAREYGARRAYAFAAGLAVPFSGFTLFYEAAGWPAGLTAFTGVAFFWWGLKRQARGAQNPLVTVLLGMLAVTTGNPYAVLGVLIVLLGIFAEQVALRRRAEAVRVVLTGALVGAAVLLVFLPLLGVQSVTNRQELAALQNDTFMVPDLGDLAAASTPTYLPSITNWGGALVESLPSVYLAWFALPLLPWIRWKAAVRRLRGPISILVIGGVYAIATLGPSNVWLFRWPLRLIEYTYLAALVFLAVALSAGFARDARKARTWLSGALVGLGFYLAFAVRPEAGVKHVIGAAVTVALVVLLLRALGTGRARRVAAVMAAGTAVVLVMQVGFFPSLTDPTFRPAHKISAMKAQQEAYRGTVLQIATQPPPGRTSRDPESLILWGNLPAALERESITRYSGIGFRAFGDALCMDYKGQSCPEVWERLQSEVDGTGGTLLDALRVETVVVQKAGFPRLARTDPPDGWSTVAEDDVRVVWRRDAPLPFPGRVSGVSDDLAVSDSEATETSERVRVVSPVGGQLTFARLAWPGYTATADGAAIPVTRTDEGLVQLDVPAGAAVVELSYTPPGVILGGTATVVAVILAAVLGFVTRRRRVVGTREDHSGTAASRVPVPADRVSAAG